MAIIETKGLSKIFHTGGKEVTALDNVDLNIQKNDFALIKGPSGCGKSTLLFAMGGLLNPSAGAVRVVFQSYYLLPYLSVSENIMLLNKVDGINVTKEEVIKVAERLNIHQRLEHLPSELSVGEKQRTSLARALVVKPSIILADEPTGNLDPENAAEVIRYLYEFREQGGTVVMVTHGTDADKYATRHINMKEGRVGEL